MEALSILPCVKKEQIEPSKIDLFTDYLKTDGALELLEEVVALIVYKYESREVLYVNLPDSLHT